jgi:sec-independent protein translocase protein TatC
MVEPQLTVTGHLEELRNRIIVSLAAVLIASAVSFPFSSAILGALKAPAGGAIGTLVYFSPEEAFLVYFRISLITGLVVSFPVIAYQAWAFTSPAVGRGLRSRAAPFVAASAAAFIAGCSFGYLCLLPAALKFLLSIGRDELTPMISAGRYISFVTGIILACGAVFEMPVVSFFFAKAGVISSRMMRRSFKYAFVAILIISAVITPTPDVFNMMVLALPMIALYEMSIWIVFLTEKRRGGYVR